MRFSRLQNAVLGLGLLAVAGFVANTTAPLAGAQSSVTGAVSGTVMDGSGAVVPGAVVIVIDTATDSKQTVKTNAEGRYTVGLLKPGLYKVTASADSLKSDTLQVSVILGSTVPADIKVTPTGSNTVVEVTSTSLPLLDTQNVALATTFNEEQLQDLPTPGGDVTTIAFTAPGVVVNAGGSYGNFSSDGLPGISNLFVLNGFDNQDPFLNLNNSGSSNLTLGQGELAEATVIQNGYNSQYGRAAGAVINYTTKSGTNKYHGMLDYNYNGTDLNANGWFNGFYGLPRPHAVSNEWAANAGGPIIKDKLFFFADWEGLRYVLPGAAGLVNFPSPAFQTAALANVAPLGSNVVSTYNQAFAAYQGAASYNSATPLTVGDGTINGGCGDYAGSPAPGGGYFGAYPTGVTSGNLVPCMNEAAASVNNINKEWLFTGRADWNINDKHKIYGRYKMDRGSQPTGTSFISPLFSTVSIQPEYEGQFNDSYVISPTKTNVFVAAANWYTAYFGPADVAAAQAAFPWNAYTDTGGDNSGNPTLGATGLATLGVPYYFPQGRNVTQYQLEDDFSWIKGKHTLKLGANFRRDLVEDYDAQVLTDFPLNENFDLATFANGSLNAANGVTGIYIQNYITQTDAHLALYNLGAYFQDEFQASPKLKLTMGVRVDRTGNPLCHQGCFSQYTGTFPNSSASLTEPYNSEVNAQNWHAFPKVQLSNIQPRFGFNYSIDDKTEIRGGAGIFADLYPAGFLDGEIQNFPNDNSIEVLTGTLASSGAGSLTANAGAGNAAIAGGFGAGQNVTQINANLSAQGVPFQPPTMGAYFPGTFKSPEYTEYSLQFQRQLTKSDAIVITYAGNFGFNEVIENPDLNPSNGEFGVGPSAANPWGALANLGPSVGATPPDPSFGKVTAFTNDAHSNYNGGMISYKRNGHGFTGQLSYTYSHSLDMVSNGGEGENYNSLSVTQQLTPTLGPGNLNYSNSDYDIRNNLTGDAIYAEPFKVSNKILNEFVAGWTVGAKTYYRGGIPFTITDLALGNAGLTSLGGTFMVNSLVDRRQLTNTLASNPHAAVTTPGLDATQYADPNGSFGNLRRNSLYGPHYVDTDLTLSKKIVTAEGFTLQIGANAYNAFNNVNFSNPNNSSGSGAFGLITGTNAPPTSPYGSFQGAAVTQRVLQVHGKITF